MDSLRLWILGVAAGSFAAGMLVGHLFPMATAAGSLAPPEDIAYVARLATTYGLSAEQQRRLRFVLQASREREIEILLSASGNQLPQPQMGEMLDLRNKTEKRIRALLDDEQRARYDRDSRPPGRPAATEDKR